jgi:hypothetical protein
MWWAPSSTGVVAISELCKLAFLHEVSTALMPCSHPSASVAKTMLGLEDLCPADVFLSEVRRAGDEARALVSTWPPYGLPAMVFRANTLSHCKMFNWASEVSGHGITFGSVFDRVLDVGYLVATEEWLSVPTRYINLNHLIMGHYAFVSPEVVRRHLKAAYVFVKT